MVSVVDVFDNATSTELIQHCLSTIGGMASSMFQEVADTMYKLDLLDILENKCDNTPEMTQKWLWVLANLSSSVNISNHKSFVWVMNVLENCNENENIILKEA